MNFLKMINWLLQEQEKLKGFVTTVLCCRSLHGSLEICSLEDSIKAFKGILNGDYDDLPEQAFYMLETIEEAVKKRKHYKNEIYQSSIVSSSEEIYSGEATMVFATGTLGELESHLAIPLTYWFSSRACKSSNGSDEKTFVRVGSLKFSQT